jgi:hypothetical protein
MMGAYLRASPAVNQGLGRQIILREIFLTRDLPI